MRCAQTDKCRNNVGSAGVGDGGGHSFRLRGAGDDLQLVAQPLDGSAGYKNTPFDGKLWSDVGRGGASREQAMLRDGLAHAGMHQGETPRAVRVLRKTGTEARLAKERGLLVAGDSCDGNFSAEMLAGSGRADAARRDDLRYHLR